MAFLARRPFKFEGTEYVPGDVVEGFPERFNRAEGFIRTGFIVEQIDVEKGETLPLEEPAKEPEEVKPVAKKTRARKPSTAKMTEVKPESAGV